MFGQLTFTRWSDWFRLAAALTPFQAAHIRDMDRVCLLNSLLNKGVWSVDGLGSNYREHPPFKVSFPSRPARTFLRNELVVEV